MRDDCEEKIHTIEETKVTNFLQSPPDCILLLFVIYSILDVIFFCKYGYIMWLLIFTNVYL